MKLLFVMLVWMVMALLLVGGVVLAVKGSLWLLAVGVVAFVLAVAKIGCLSH
ncbi:MAG: hypothetical protein ABSF38_16585 [Verrucomicrobiota bacterium]|jgi:hypothetical protein